MGVVWHSSRVVVELASRDIATGSVAGAQVSESSSVMHKVSSVLANTSKLEPQRFIDADVLRSIRVIWRDQR